MNSFMTENPHVLVNDVDLETFDLCVMERPAIPSPKRNQATLDNKYSYRGTRRTDLGWGDIDIKVKLNYLNVSATTLDSFRKDFYKMRKWIMKGTRLRFNDDLPVEYYVKAVSISEATSEILQHGVFTVTFTCDPFPYKVDDLVTFSFKKTTGRETYIINDGNYRSFPVFRLSQDKHNMSKNSSKVTIKLTNIDDGTDNSTITINGWDQDSVKDLDLIIDSANAIAYFENPDTKETSLAWDHLTFNEYPTLDVGEYRLSVDWSPPVGNEGQTDTYEVLMDLDRGLVY